MIGPAISSTSYTRIVDKNPKDDKDKNPKDPENPTKKAKTSKSLATKKSSLKFDSSMD